MIGVVGAGKWGQNIIRVLQGLGEHVETFDLYTESTYGDFDLLLNDADRIVVATPPETHLEYAAKTVRKRRPLFVEKPLTLDFRSALWLNEMVFSQVHVGHILCHAEGFQKLKAEGPKTFGSYRGGNNPGYHGVTALWDIGVHDIAAAVNLFGEPLNVAASVQPESYEVWLEFRWGHTAHLEGSRVDPEKRWDMLFDNQPYSPYGETVEPLLAEMEAFLDGYHNLDEALTVVKTLERCDT